MYSDRSWQFWVKYGEGEYIALLCWVQFGLQIWVTGYSRLWRPEQDSAAAKRPNMEAREDVEHSFCWPDGGFCHFFVCKFFLPSKLFGKYFCWSSKKNQREKWDQKWQFCKDTLKRCLTRLVSKWCFYPDTADTRWAKRYLQCESSYCNSNLTSACIWSFGQLVTNRERGGGHVWSQPSIDDRNKPLLLQNWVSHHKLKITLHIVCISI